MKAKIHLFNVFCIFWQQFNAVILKEDVFSTKVVLNYPTQIISQPLKITNPSSNLKMIFDNA